MTQADLGSRTLLLAVACGLIAANVYYAQPLVGPISAAIGLPPAGAGLIVTLTQIGYGAGLLLVVPLGDMFENRRLIQIVLCFDALALAGAALSTRPSPLLLSALCIGVGSVAVQIIVPYATHIAPEAVRGQLIGRIMSGLMFGIMLARPAASLITELLSWHAVFALSSVLMAGLAWVVGRGFPLRRPPPGMRYADLLTSLGRLVLTTPALRRRSLYQAGLFAAFSLFWTIVPLMLAGPPFGLSQGGIALFGLAGAAGALAAPVAGRIADSGRHRLATGLAILTVAEAFPLTWLHVPSPGIALALLVSAAILIDLGVSVNLILGQRQIFALGAEYRSRLNGLYIAAFFVGGAFGSALGSFAYARGGWGYASAIGLALPLLALAYFVTERAVPGQATEPIAGSPSP